jgi:branched-chain amino acid transport system substrate-binding protein
MRVRRSFVVACIISIALIASSLHFTAPPAQAEKTIKIGVVFFLGWSLGLETVKCLDAIAEDFNRKGGIAIGGEKYKVELIKYDSKFTHEASRAAVERLVYNDNVKFILGDETVDGWLPVTEENKVLALAISPAPAIFNPKNKYAFQVSTLQTDAPQMWGWFAKNNPQIKNIVCAFPDNKLGRIRSGLAEKLSKTFGPKLLDTIFYPPNTTDFSALATKVMSLNSDSFSATAGGVTYDSLCYKAVWQAGYKGTRFSFVDTFAGSAAQVTPMEALEGWIVGAYGPEKDPQPPAAKAFYDAYVAKYGKWDYPSTSFSNGFYILMAALEKAQSFDTDKLAKIIGSGLRFECINGPGLMISRPDEGNTRTVDTLVGASIKRVEGGKPKILVSMSADEALEYNKRFYGWK